MKILFLVIVFVSLVIPFEAFAEIIHQDAGKINNLVIDGDAIYFFETDQSINSTTWTPDTNIYVYDGSGTRLVSDVKFMFPMELAEHGNYIYFSNLEDFCIGNIICDHQDIIRMSKSDGSFETIADQLKSAVRLSVEDKNLYVSESNGKIWKINHDNTAPILLYETNNIIIMDIMTEKDGTVYWIEEIKDQNNSILKMEPNSEPVVIASELSIPYDLKDDHGQFWKEIYVGVNQGSAGEFTKITEHKDSSNIVLGDFKNTSPLSNRQHGSHHGPYFVIGEYLIFSNNTKSNSVIQMQNTITEQHYDLQTVDYDVEFMKAQGNSLYVVGSNQDGFLIDRITLPVSVPEFSSFVMFILAIGILLSIASFRKFSLLKQLY